MHYNFPEIPNKKKEIFIYGTGGVGEKVYSHFFKSYKIKGFIQTSKQLDIFKNKKVYDLNELESININSYTYILASKANEKEMSYNLKCLGIDFENIIFLEDLKIKRDFLYYPQITSEKLLREIVEKTEWFFPENNHNSNKIYLYTDKFLKNKYSNRGYKSRIEFIDEISDKFMQECILLLWKKEDEGKLIKSGYLDAYLVDKNYGKGLDFWNYVFLFNKTLPQEYFKKMDEISKMNYEELLSLNYDKSYLFASGPNLKKYNFNDELRNSFRFACNGVIKDSNLMNLIKPNIITIADWIWFFSSSKYSFDYRFKLEEYIINNKCFLIIPKVLQPLLSIQYPRIANSIIGIDSLKVNGWHFPNKNELWIKEMDNIATIFMIPLASSLTDDILLIGFDGKKINQNFKITDVWEKIELKDDDLVKSLVNDYPSWFSLTSQEQQYYYLNHCENMESIISFGEMQNKNYKSLTNSYIPALLKRT